ncbi:cysteine desulfurase family protein [Staphylococcus capitis]|uniref:cysteine desulfurase family protein n=1 Tax=Staphylococcus TaxID=1279 RepID=UPI00019290ED|nr:cysteine desulfurase family protein [Staphylococcus capitis]EEE49094.1 aminotransferase, class V [Staphylococcus capitis SK14]EGS40855.1 aminotransferase, class V [Staphylococcus capitis VCU116]MCT2013607.1 cysteine desulfurase [Staphylococcus capitis]MEB5628835.1 cysteine desulfurase [Staphylococcus capitis]OAO27711.1 aminotransferase [Staphylococcus capitis]
MIYLDNAATTKADQDVIDSFVKVNQSLYFNPNSPHQAGLQAEQVLKQAKEEIDSALNLNHLYHIVFTSGATESNNMALKGIAYMKRETANEIITSVLEHPSVLEVMRYLEEKQGFKLKYVDVKSDGKIDTEHLKSLMSDKVGLVTCMYVNNIMGQIQPIQDIVNILKDYPRAHLHVDAVQALGKVSMNLNGVDSLSLSGHKFNGLKGQGLLIIKNIQNIEPVVHGGGQEYGLRSGTVNLPMAVSMVKSIKLTMGRLDEASRKLNKMNQSVRTFLEEFRGVYINSPKDSAPQIINVSFPGVKGEVLVNAFSKHGVMISTTSACSSKRGKLNEVLLAMGVPDARIEGSIRISMGVHTTEEDIQRFKEVFEQVYEEIKELLK